MTVQGGLAAVGELHDVVAHADQSTLHVEHASGQDDAAAAAGDAPADTLHVLLHFAHCCGHAAGLDPPRMGADWSPASGARPLTAMASPALPPQLRPPFRPPIQA
ncbi:hypothetical protein FZO89_07725 [Luteimonas viscosa]|uniref:Uncharacterized protein n=1 Tax=Luteimonas viscosa TaxID=1132694 RepID=A0A5D4XNC9_9GAMM|nr:hypothetical protein [Luteimonas viscosa]TYT26156.1 hypothetical protein FZO89_07725 [Luteimonas viscosa]